MSTNKRLCRRWARHKLSAHDRGEFRHNGVLAILKKQQRLRDEREAHRRDQQAT